MMFVLWSMMMNSVHHNICVILQLLDLQLKWKTPIIHHILFVLNVI